MLDFTKENQGALYDVITAMEDEARHAATYIRKDPQTDQIIIDDPTKVDKAIASLTESLTTVMDHPEELLGVEISPRPIDPFSSSSDNSI